MGISPPDRSMEDRAMSSGISLGAVILALFSFFLGMLASVLSEHLKRAYFAPELRLTCNPDDKAFTPIAEVPGPFADERSPDGEKPPEVQSRYVRVAVTNHSETRSTAKACRAYLTKIRIVRADRTTEETDFAESL